MRPLNRAGKHQTGQKVLTRKGRSFKVRTALSPKNFFGVDVSDADQASPPAFKALAASPNPEMPAELDWMIVEVNAKTALSVNVN